MTLKLLAIFFYENFYFFSCFLPTRPTPLPGPTPLKVLSHPTAGLLMDGTWHLTAWQTIADTDTTDRHALMPVCQRDDQFNFEAAGVLVRTEGPSACPGNQPCATVTMRSWSLDATGTKLTLGVGGTGTVKATYHIVQLTTDALKLRCTRVVDGVAVTELLSYLN